MKRLSLLLLSHLALLPICIAMGAAPEPVPVEPGALACSESSTCDGAEFPLVIPEDLFHYRFGWNGIPAFDGTIQATRHEGTRPWYLFRLEGGTRRWLDLIYKMRDRMEAVVDGSNYQPRAFYVRMRAPRDRTDLTVRFHHDRHMAHAVWITNGRVKERDIAFRKANDPVTVIYLLEKLRAPGDEATFEVVNGRANYQVGLRVVGRERIKVRAGSFDTLVLEPTLNRLDKPNYKPKFKKMTIWVTEGPTRIPVKLRSEVFIGSVSGELVGVTPRDAQARSGLIRRLPL